MSIKQELLQWSEACKAYEEGDYDAALDLFDTIADSSKIHFNIGMIFQAIGQHDEAILSFADSVQCDNYLSVAYFQKGVSLYIMQDYDLAREAFDDAFVYFRGTNSIDYTQLGLEYKLYSCEVLYNRALASFQIGDEKAALQDLNQASKCKQIAEHDIIQEAIQYRGDGCQLFQVPQNLLYNPPKQKLANAAKVDYLGQSKVVAATDPSDNFTEFKGARGMINEPEPVLTPIQTVDRTAPRGRRPSAAPTPTSANPSMSRRQQPGPFSPTSMDRRQPEPYPPSSMDRRQPEPYPPSSMDRRQPEPYPPSSMDRRQPQPYPPSPNDGYPPSPRDTRNPYPPSPTRNAYPSYPSSPRDSRYPPSTLERSNTGRRPSGRGNTGPPPPKRQNSLYAESDYGTIRSSTGGGGYGSSSAGKLRVKVNFGDRRMIMLPADATYDELVDKIVEKFGSSRFRITFRDEDEEFVSMMDDDDFLLCRSLSSDENKIEIWCE